MKIPILMLACPYLVFMEITMTLLAWYALFKMPFCSLPARLYQTWPDWWSFMKHKYWPSPYIKYTRHFLVLLFLFITWKIVQHLSDGGNDVPCCWWQDNLSAIDILSACNLVNYFGKMVLGGSGVGQITLCPILIRKVSFQSYFMEAFIYLFTSFYIIHNTTECSRRDQQL